MRTLAVQLILVLCLTAILASANVTIPGNSHAWTSPIADQGIDDGDAIARALHTSPYLSKTDGVAELENIFHFPEAVITSTDWMFELLFTDVTPETSWDPWDRDFDLMDHRFRPSGVDWHAVRRRFG